MIPRHSPLAARSSAWIASSRRGLRSPAGGRLICFIVVSILPHDVSLPIRGSHASRRPSASMPWRFCFQSLGRVRSVVALGGAFRRWFAILRRCTNELHAFLRNPESCYGLTIIPSSHSQPAGHNPTVLAFRLFHGCLVAPQRVGQKRNPTRASFFQLPGDLAIWLATCPSAILAGIMACARLDPSARTCTWSEGRFEGSQGSRARLRFAGRRLGSIPGFRAPLTR